MTDRLKIVFQHILPKRSLTRAAGKMAGAQGGLMTTRLISWFVRQYRVDMTEAENPDIRSYKSFNDFFSRALRPGLRPLASADFICPVDGAISQFGVIEDRQILQAKGHHFGVTQLVGGVESLADQFRHGYFANLYLAPKDYHRLHMPCDGRLVRMIHVPGALFSVNPSTARGVKDLFSRNERVVCQFESPEHGPFVMVLVGATIVGSMATAWHGLVKPAASSTSGPRHTNPISEWTYLDRHIVLKQGEEMGRFLLGSTVIMLFRPNSIVFNPAWLPEQSVRLGEAMGNRKI